MKQLLIVCTGNICRSPMAEGIVRYRAQQERVSHLFAVRSAGTNAAVGASASHFGLEVLSTHGINMYRHVATQLTHDHITQATLIMAMEEAHRTEIFNLSSSELDKVMLLSELSGRYYDIPDPYGGTRVNYQSSFAQINGIIQAGWTSILAAMDIPHQSTTEGTASQWH